MPIPVANRNPDGTVDLSIVFSGQNVVELTLTIREVVALIVALTRALR